MKVRWRERAINTLLLGRKHNSGTDRLVDGVLF